MEKNKNPRNLTYLFIIKSKFDDFKKEKEKSKQNFSNININATFFRYSKRNFLLKTNKVIKF